MNTTELIIIRHGQTTWNAERRWQGQLDSPLSELGKKQAAAVATRFHRDSISALYASDLSRAAHTAEAISEFSGLQVALDERLRERKGGIFEGLTREEAMHRYPDLYEQAAKREPNFAVAGGESAQQLCNRAVEIFTEIVKRHPGERIVAVTHGGLLATFLVYLMQIPLGQPLPVRLANTSVNVTTFDSEHWRVQTIGDIAHLTNSISSPAERLDLL